VDERKAAIRRLDENFNSLVDFLMKTNEVGLSVSQVVAFLGVRLGRRQTDDRNDTSLKYPSRIDWCELPHGRLIAPGLSFCSSGLGDCSGVGLSRSTVCP